jgi:N-dimethylarginine dimethylaminohydrolase
MKSTKLEKVHIMIEPPHDWLTLPPAVAADGNATMLKAMQQGSTHPAGSGSTVIKELSTLFKQLGFSVALCESSKAAQRVTKRIIGQPNPDDVFTVDCCTGHELGGGHVNIINNMSAATRLLEPIVLKMIATRLGVQNIATQGAGIQFEGGDFTFLPHGINGAESLLVTGGGKNSRSNQAGHDWLKQTLNPQHKLNVVSQEFHRDLVSVFVQDTRGALVLALLAMNCIQNPEEVVSSLQKMGINILEVPQEAVAHCAVNLLVNPGHLVGMQSHHQLADILKNGLPAGVQYHALPANIQQHMQGFVDMQGGANCVSGHVLVDPEKTDLSAGNIADINAYLHSKDCEDLLQAEAEKMGMSEAIELAKEKQHQAVN